MVWLTSMMVTEQCLRSSLSRKCTALECKNQSPHRSKKIVIKSKLSSQRRKIKKVAELVSLPILEDSEMS